MNESKASEGRTTQLSPSKKSRELLPVTTTDHGPGSIVLACHCQCPQSPSVSYKRMACPLAGERVCVCPHIRICIHLHLFMYAHTHSLVMTACRSEGLRLTAGLAMLCTTFPRMIPEMFAAVMVPKPTFIRTLIYLVYGVHL